jgi:nickel-dependent lactate racemase
MPSKQFTLRYGKGNISFEIPQTQLAAVVTGRDVKALDDLSDAYLDALDHPIDSAPLRYMLKPGETVAVIVSDITRTWQRNDLTLPLLLDYLNDVGIPDDHVTVIIAVGGHRQNTAAEFEEICSRSVCHRVKVVNHKAWETDNMIPIGCTSRGT